MEVKVIWSDLHRYFVYCKSCNRFVATWPTTKPIPYKFKCPFCGTEDKPQRLRKWNGQRLTRTIVFVYGTSQAYKKLKEQIG